MTKDNKHYLGEINPRFGGGFPLAYYSGANMIQHIKKLVEKRNSSVITDIRNRGHSKFVTEIIDNKC